MKSVNKKISKIIYSALVNNDYVNMIVNDRIYPMVAPEGTMIPFAVYEHNIKGNSTSDGVYGYDITTTITFISNEYDDVMSAGGNAIYTLDDVLRFNGGGKYEDDDIIINGFDVIDVDDSFSDNLYIEKITISYKLFTKN